MSDVMDGVQDLVLVEQEMLQARCLARAAAAANHRPTSATCLDCDEQIDTRRLRAMPHATRCTECQDRSERRVHSHR